MDLGTSLGLILGFLLVFGGIAQGGLGLMGYWNLPSALIVLGGAFSATLVAMPAGSLLSLRKIIRNAFFEKPLSPESLIAELVRYAEIARRDGILSLENVRGRIQDGFIVKGIQMAVDGTDPEIIEQILKLDLAATEERHARGQKIFKMLGYYCPAFGMMGTLIGLVAMLQQLENPKTIGPSMAVALLTTFYGVVLANLVFLPLADKLGARTEDERLIKEIVICGVMSIQSGDNPRIVEQKLRSFLPKPRRRAEARAAPKA